MLERVAARLESGGSHLLRRGGQCYAKRTSLRSTLYVRGCGLECGAPAVEAGSTPPGEMGWEDVPEGPEEDAPQQTSTTTPPTATRRTKSTPVTHLDFLYPSKTLAFLENLTIVTPKGYPAARGCGGFALGGARRGYATVRETVVPTAHQRPLPELVLESPPKTLAEFRRRVAKETALRKDASDAEIIRARQFAGLQSLAWDLFQAEGYPDDSEDLDFLVSYLAKDLTPTNARRIIEVVAGVRSEGRSRVCWDALVIAQLTLGNEPAAFKCLEYVAASTENVTDCGFERYIAYHIAQERWDLVIKGYSVLRATRYRKEPLEGQKERYTLRMQLQNLRLGIYAPGYEKNMIPWVMALPENPQTREEVLKDDLGLELIRGWCWVQCNFVQEWTPEYQSVWDWMVSQKRWRPYISRKRWQDAIWNAARGRKWEHVLRMYNDWMKNDKPEVVSVVALNNVLEAHAWLGHNRQVSKMTDMIFKLSPNNRPGKRTYIILLDHFGRRGETEKAEKLFSHFRQIYPVLHPDNFYGILNAYKNFVDLRRPDADRTASVDSLIIWFQRIRDEFGLQPDATCYNILLEGVAKGGDMDVTMAWLKDMVDNRCMPNRRTLEAIMGLFGKHGYVDSAEDLLDMMISKNIDRTSGMYHSLVKAYIRAGMPEDAYRVLKRLQYDLNVSLTPIWNTVISGFLDHGDTERARQVFLEMQELGLKFDEFTYAISIHWILLVKDMQTAEEVATRMWRLGRPVSLNVYLNIMAGYLKAENPEAACEIFMTMLERGIRPSFVSLGLFFQAYGRMPQVARVEMADRFDPAICQLMSEVLLDEEEHPIPTWLMNQILEINSRHHALANSMKLFHKFNSQPERRTNMKYWSRMMVLFKQAGDLEGLREMYDAMKKSCRRIFFEVTGPLRLQKVLPTHRFYMSHPLQIWMDAMIDTTRVDIPALEAEIADLLNSGYELNNENWNSWVQCLAISGDILRAADEFEKQLARDWANFRIFLRYQQRPRGPDEPNLVFDARSSHRRPFAKTISTLATEVDALSRRRWNGDTEAEAMLGELARRAPHLLESFRMFEDMPERIDRVLLYRMSRLQDIQRNQSEISERLHSERVRNLTPAPVADDPTREELLHLRDLANPPPPTPPASALDFNAQTGPESTFYPADLLRTLREDDDPQEGEEGYYPSPARQHRVLVDKLGDFSTETVFAERRMPRRKTKGLGKKKEEARKLAELRARVGLSPVGGGEEEGLRILEAVRGLMPKRETRREDAQTDGDQGQNDR